MPNTKPLTVAALVAEYTARVDELTEWEKDLHRLRDGRHDTNKSPLIPIAEAKLEELRAAHKAFIAQVVSLTPPTGEHDAAPTE